jgi:hypothetical protein
MPHYKVVTYVMSRIYKTYDEQMETVNVDTSSSSRQIPHVLPKRNNSKILFPKFVSIIETGMLIGLADGGITPTLQASSHPVSKLQGTGFSSTSGMHKYPAPARLGEKNFVWPKLIFSA